MSHPFMQNNLPRRSFQENLKRTIYLLKSSFVLVGKNTGIVRPTVYLCLLSMLMTSLAFGALACFFSGRHVMTGMAALAFLLLVLAPLRFFIRTFLKAIQSWMTYRTITGNPVVYAEARRHTMTRASGLMFLGLVDMTIAWMNSRRDRPQGITAVVGAIFFSALKEVWDLLNHYMIPAVVVEGKPLKESLPEIKALRENVPSTLVGVFGVDFAGDALRKVLFFPYMLVTLCGIGLGYLLGPGHPSLSWNIEGHLIHWVPILCALFLNFSAGGILKACVDSIKTIYFTIFYTSIVHAEAIPEEYREHLTGYLLMGNQPQPS